MLSRVQVRRLLQSPRLPIEASCRPSPGQVTRADLIYYHPEIPSPAAAIPITNGGKNHLHMDAQASADKPWSKYRIVQLKGAQVLASTGSLQLPTPHQSFNSPLHEVVGVENRVQSEIMLIEPTGFKGSDDPSCQFTARVKANLGHGFLEDDLPPETIAASQKLGLTGLAAITGHHEVAKYRENNLCTHDSELAPPLLHVRACACILPSVCADSHAMHG